MSEVVLDIDRDSYNTYPVDDAISFRITRNYVTLLIQTKTFEVREISFRKEEFLSLLKFIEK